MRLTQKASGVSPAVGVVLLLAVTVTIFSLVGVYTFDIAETRNDKELNCGELTTETFFGSRNADSIKCAL